MAEPEPKDRVLPCLLDRLTDDRPHLRTEPAEHRVFNLAQLRRSIRRDLEWLLNARSKLTSDRLGGYAELPSSVLNFGLEDLCGRSMQTVEVQRLEQMICGAILAFEPRLMPQSVEVTVGQADPARTNVAFDVEIRGLVNAQPTPEALLFQSTLDIETGKFILRG